VYLEIVVEDPPRGLETVDGAPLLPFGRDKCNRGFPPLLLLLLLCSQLMPSCPLASTATAVPPANALLSPCFYCYCCAPS